MEPRSLSESLAMRRRQYGMSEPEAVDAVIDAWPRVAGSLAEVSKVLGVFQGRLVVGVRDPAMVEPLQWKAAEIRRNLAEIRPDLAFSAIDTRILRDSTI